MVAKFKKALPEYEIKKGDKLPIVGWSTESQQPRLFVVYKGKGTDGHKIDVGRSEIKIIES